MYVYIYIYIIHSVKVHYVTIDVKQHASTRARRLSKGSLAIRHVFNLHIKQRSLMYYHCTREAHKLLNPPLLTPLCELPIVALARRHASFCADAAREEVSWSRIL